MAELGPRSFLRLAVMFLLSIACTLATMAVMG